MISPSFTPGPWRVADATGGIYDISDVPLFNVMATDPDGGYEIPLSVDVSEPDARLIAAAPELYALVRRFVVDHEEETEPYGCSCQRCEEARVILAQIEGRP